MDPLEELRRKDKWFLGGGTALVWAPPFPAYLDWPGFWDEAQYFDYTIERPFTLAVLDEQHRSVPLKPLSRDWRPSELTTAWMAGDSLLSERKCVLPENVLVSEMTIWNPTDRARRLDVVAYTQQWTAPSSGIDVVSNVSFDGRALHFSKRRELQIRGQDAPALSYTVMLGADRHPASFEAQLSEWNSFRPDWELTPFYERMSGGALGSQLQLSGVDDDGALYLGLHYPVEIEAESRARLILGCAIDGDLGQLLLQPVETSQQAWLEYFEGLPTLEVAEPYLQKYWWYRWYGLRLNTISMPNEHAAHPFVAEGMAQFRNHISYSAQAHVLETRWAPDRALAQGSILNFVENQAENGSLPANIYAGWVNSAELYHANWGRVLTELESVHPDDAFLKHVYPALSRYAQFLDDERDPEGCHLYDVINQAETGQEYMSRYQAVDPRADYWGTLRLKGVDATVYAYQLQRALAWLARLLGQKADAAHWSALADATRQAVRELMWEPKLEMFTDVNPETGKLTGVKAAVGFYPFMTDIATTEHLPAIRNHLLNPREFWTPFPVPATPADDAYFSPWGEWKGKRTSCPWNGRVWPMTNSHVCEALANASQTLDRSLQPVAAELILRFVRMMFHDGDADRPNSFEHYNPYSGQPSMYRGIDDYQHSWVVDLLVRYLGGVQPQLDGELVLDPLPFDVASFELANLQVRGHGISSSWSAAEGFVVLLDGQLKHHSVERQRVAFDPDR